MKLERVVEGFADAALTCPHCGKALSPNGCSFVCVDGHCFDVSSRGYINLAKVAGDPKYDRELFSARKQILPKYYRPVLDAILQVLPMGTVLDAGCGEGYYATAMAKSGRDVYAIDLAKDAILCADKDSNVKYIVGDLAALPFSDSTFDGAINVLSPCSYREFFRVLKPGGCLIKVVPGENYLAELRESLGMPAHSGADTIASFNKHMSEPTAKRITYKVQIAKEDSNAFFRMTPLTFHADETPMPEEITIDLWLLVGKK